MELSKILILVFSLLFIMAVALNLLGIVTMNGVQIPVFNNLSVRSDWYIMGDDGCAPLSKAGAGLHRPEDVMAKYSCRKLSDKRLYLSLTKNYYLLDCEQKLGINLTLVNGQETCNKKRLELTAPKSASVPLATSDLLGSVNDKYKDLVAQIPESASTQAENDMPDWYMLDQSGCRILTDIDPQTASFSQYMAKYACQARTDSSFPNMFRVSCNNIEGEVILAYKRDNCESLIPFVLKQKNN